MEELTASKSISNIKPETSDQDVYDVASGLAQLQSYPVSVIRKVETDLVNAG